MFEVGDRVYHKWYRSCLGTYLGTFLGMCIVSWDVGIPVHLDSKCIERELCLLSRPALAHDSFLELFQ